MAAHGDFIGGRPMNTNYRMIIESKQRFVTQIVESSDLRLQDDKVRPAGGSAALNRLTGEQGRASSESAEMDFNLKFSKNFDQPRNARREERAHDANLALINEPGASFRRFGFSEKFKLANQENSE